MKIVAVRDSAVQQYMTPVTVTHVGQAIRGFGDEAKNPETPIGKHPEDYELWEIGEFNPDTGEITPVQHRSLARAVDMKGA